MQEFRRAAKESGLGKASPNKEYSGEAGLQGKDGKEEEEEKRNHQGSRERRQEGEEW